MNSTPKDPELEAPENQQSRRIVLRNAVFPGDIAFVDDRIVSVGRVESLPGDVDIDCRDCIVTAGLVNTHHHLWQWLNRGAGVNEGLFGWLSGLYPEWSQLTQEEVLAAAIRGMTELLRGGCTTLFDHHYIVPRRDVAVFEVLLEAADYVGVRFMLGRGCMDLGASAGGLPPDDIVEEPEAIFRSISSIHGLCKDLPLADVVVAPNSLFTSSLNLIRDARELATELDCLFHLHLAESLDEESFSIERYGGRPVPVIEDLGGLRSDTWLGHAIHLNGTEIDILAKSETGVSHCPSSNARLAMGMCPVEPLVDAGVAVSLGVDGAASNEVGRLLPEVKQAMFMARLRSGHADSLSPAAAFSLATEGGADCLGRGDLGRLEPGSTADIVVWPAADLADISSPLDGLVLGPDRLARDVWVGGRRRVVDSSVVGVDSTAERDALSRTDRRGFPPKVG